MELDEYERQKLSPNRTHSYIYTTSNIENTNSNRIIVSNTNSNSNFIQAKNLQNENERLRKLIKTYQIKYEMFTSHNQNNKSTNIKENHKINKLIVNTQYINKNIQQQKIYKTKQCSTSSTPRQNNNVSTTLNTHFINRSTQKIIPNTKVNSSRISRSHLKKRINNKINSNQCNETHGNSTTLQNDIRNESCIMINRKYQNLLEEFDSFKIVNFNKKESNGNNVIKRKTSAIIENNKKTKLKKQGHMKYNSSISNSNGGDVIINNVNYINVFPSNYNNNTSNSNNNTIQKMNILKHKIKHTHILNKK